MDYEGKEGEDKRPIRLIWKPTLKIRIAIVGDGSDVRESLSGEIAGSGAREKSRKGRP